MHGWNLSIIIIVQMLSNWSQTSANDFYLSTDIDQIPQSAPSSINPGMGLQLGYSGFSHDQNNHDSSGVYVNCILLRESKTGVKRCMAHKDRGRILFMFVPTCVVSKNRNTRNWSSMGDNTITAWGGIGVLGSPFYICDTEPHFWSQLVKMWLP